MQNYDSCRHEDNKCPVCFRSDGLSELCLVNGYKVFTCATCGADYVFPFPEPTLLKAYYSRPEWYQGGELGGYHNYDQQTEWSLTLVEKVLEDFGDTTGLSVLDVGCGYGNHLELAVQRGWKCFGVELSDHARVVAADRLGDSAYLAERVSDLLPHSYDLVLLLDTIEHVASPYALFFELFSLGAVTPKTRFVITTPNAGSRVARSTPTAWQYRHPPSHLVFYSAETLELFLSRLRFTEVKVSGMLGGVCSDDFSASEGLLAVAAGSDFSEFMHERYVPGTWSKLAEYEHLPRYVLAKRWSKDKRVLDFGCGTGYGSAILAGNAAQVVGLDIDPSALDWAKNFHRNPALSFLQSADLGEALAAASFDLVTCFEMIEHVDHATQKSVISSIGRLLAHDGILVISTPNPEVTKQYGENPYHLREMTRDEFFELLSAEFPHVAILDQGVQTGVTFSVGEDSSFESISEQCATGRPLAYVAICSKTSFREIRNAVFFDEDDFVGYYLEEQKKLNAARLFLCACQEKSADLVRKELAHNLHLSNMERVLEIKEVFLQEQQGNIQRLHDELAEKEISLSQQMTTLQLKEAELQNVETVLQITKTELAQREATLAALRRTKVFRLREVILNHPWGLRKVAHMLYLVLALITPGCVRRAVAPCVAYLRGLVSPAKSYEIHADLGCSPYQVTQLHVGKVDAPRVAHVIANFMTGGSTRLVLDLVEYLGQEYNQFVLTSFQPAPLAYAGLEIEECRYPVDKDPFVEYFKRIAPDIVHVHYWGDCDEPWYGKAICAAEYLGLPVVENINTPVTPYYSNAVCRYIYVSDYVRRVFGQDHPNHQTIHPGSDFSHFERSGTDLLPENCVGMVYRLERDKLNEQSIEPFIRIVQTRPQTKVVIVGGGSLLDVFREAVVSAGVSGNFEFAGYVSYESLPDWYRKMTLFIAPVWKESFGQVSSFAMNMRVPVIGYDVGAISEIVETTELLAPPGNSEKLAQIAIQLLNDGELRDQVGRRQRERVQKSFSVQSMVDSYAQVYSEVYELFAASKP